MPARKPKPQRKPKAAPPPAFEAVPAPKARRPGVEYVPSEQDERTVRSMGTWADQLEIAKVLGISHVTLRKHFRDTLDTAFLRAQNDMWRSLYRQGMGSPGRKADVKRGIPAIPATPPNVKATIAWLEFRAGASTRITVVDGGSEVDPATLTDEQIAERLTKLKRTGAVVRASKAQGTVH